MPKPIDAPADKAGKSDLKQSYTVVVTPIYHDQTLYAVGSTIALTAAQAARLPKLLTPVAVAAADAPAA